LIRAAVRMRISMPWLGDVRGLTYGREADWKLPNIHGHGAPLIGVDSIARRRTVQCLPIQL
jgi:hypothetical protein